MGMTMFHQRRAGLTGTIPTELGRLTALESLKLSTENPSPDAIFGCIPSQFGKLERLQTLDLYQDAHSLETASQLGSSSGSGNMLSCHLPTELGQLTSLVQLHLKGNHISGPIPS